MVYRPNIDATSCFVLMPLKEPHLEYFAGIIQPATREAGLTAIKADDIYGTAPIIQDIWNQIWKARAVIADVTGRNPNVNYELGICHSLGVPTVLITQDLADVPFDYRHIRCIVYDTKRVDWQDKLRRSITGTLKTLLAGSDLYEDLRWPYDTNALQSAKNINPFVPSEQGTASVIEAESPRVIPELERQDRKLGHMYKPQPQPVMLRNRGKSDALAIQIQPLVLTQGQAHFRQISILSPGESMPTEVDIRGPGGSDAARFIPPLQRRQFHNLEFLFQAEWDSKNDLSLEVMRVPFSVSYLDAAKNKFVTNGVFIYHPHGGEIEIAELAFERS